MVDVMAEVGRRELPPAGYPLTPIKPIDWRVGAPALTRMRWADDGGGLWLPAVMIWEHLRRVPSDIDVDVVELALAWPLSLEDVRHAVELLTLGGLVAQGRIVPAIPDRTQPGARLIEAGRGSKHHSRLASLVAALRRSDGDGRACRRP
jgi:hypothetical protein